MPVAAVAERLDGGGEQQRLGRRHDLRPVALLRALRPEGRELRRVEDAAGDLAVIVLELPDLRGEVVAERRIKPEIDDRRGPSSGSATACRAPYCWRRCRPDRW